MYTCTLYYLVQVHVPGQYFVLVGVVVQSAVPFLLFQEVLFNEFQAAYSKVRTTGPA